MSIESIKSLFAEYAKERPWVQSFDWQKIPIKKLNISDSSPVCAMYLALTDTILIDTDEADGVVFILFCHEMRHAYQRHSMGILKYLLKKVFFRSKLEQEAAEVEQDASDWMFEYNKRAMMNKKRGNL